METTTSCMAHDLDYIDFRTIPNGSFRIPYSQKKSKTLEFFDELYTYPPKFRVKWETIDELHEDLFTSYNYRALNQNLSFVDTLTDFLPSGESGIVEKTTYSWNSYVEGYLNKIISTRFYGKQSKQIQESLQHIPVYTVLNGQGEIVLATSTDTSATSTQTFNQTIYNLCGSFDPLSERNTKLGLFFMTKKDADIYLNEIAKLDTQGTKMLGLSIHCFGLDFAYRVMREYHPNIDFRFIPDFSEVQAVLTKQTTKNSNFVFEDDQQQLRLRRRPINIIPIVSSLNKRLSPFSSFIENADYFKGVPIYIVNVNDVPSNFFVERYHNVLNLIDTVLGQTLRFVSVGTGFGKNWILEGSVHKQISSSTVQTYIFFEKEAAIEFCQHYGKQISRYSGGRVELLESLAKKPKILVHNLEDFLELWEDTLTETSAINFSNGDKLEFGTRKINMVPAKQSRKDVDLYLQQDKNSSLGKIANFFEFKYRRLLGFVEVLLNTT